MDVIARGLEGFVREAKYFVNSGRYVVGLMEEFVDPVENQKFHARMGTLAVFIILATVGIIGALFAEAILPSLGIAAYIAGFLIGPHILLRSLGIDEEICLG